LRASQNEALPLRLCFAAKPSVQVRSLLPPGCERVDGRRPSCWIGRPAAAPGPSPADHYFSAIASAWWSPPAALPEPGMATRDSPASWAPRAA